MEPAPRAASNNGQPAGFVVTPVQESANLRVSDLDDFKAINDQHGHPAGDAVLAATARRLNDWCGRHGIAGRIGGDEFVTIVTDPAHTTGLNALRTALDRPVHHNGEALPVSASVGRSHRADLPVPTLTDADTAMYAVKGHSRRNTHH
ncbi:GGDEF domain-containing protein [Streptomyces seoulensis]|uniref:GGDEF domain-containing protein n=1 Tax=Streptomyces seoulensis TaxID=73044 RepID=UPI0033BE5E66